MEKWESALLIKKNGTVTMEDGVWQFLKILKIGLIHDLVIITTGHILKRTGRRDLNRYLYIRVPSCISHNGEAIQVSIGR